MLKKPHLILLAALLLLLGSCAPLISSVTSWFAIAEVESTGPIEPVESVIPNAPVESVIPEELVVDSC
ncbi:MAG: hypothetical protein KF893_24730, partial [Caldilineaceae bacterium]|nr:hypothetical protein [Caldilineaceae bacterium]